MSIFTLLRRLERLTRPMGHDVDEPLGDRPMADWERELLGGEPEIVPPPSTLDDVVAHLAQLCYLAEDIRNVLQHSQPPVTGDHPAAGGVPQPAHSAAGFTSGREAARVFIDGVEMMSKTSAATTPAAEESPAGGMATPPPETPSASTAPAGHLTWFGWSVRVYCGCGFGAAFADRVYDWFDWHEHVAPLIAERIGCNPAKAIAALENFQPNK